jgi:hypothetical protein
MFDCALRKVHDSTTRFAQPFLLRLGRKDHDKYTSSIKIEISTGEKLAWRYPRQARFGIDSSESRDASIDHHGGV